MASMEIEVLSRKLIKPSNPTPNHLRKLGISLFDQLAAPKYFEVIFYYSGGPDDNTAKKKAERCAQLENSLSDALSFFYLLAGRFVQDDISVDCGDQGVEFAEAKVNGKLADFMEGGLHIELSDKLLPWDSPPPVKSVTSPLLGIQINTFDCGGVVVGMNFSHVTTDAASMGAFVNAWATASRDGIDSTGVLCSNSSSSFHHEIASHFPARISSGSDLPIPPVPKPKNLADNKDKIVTKRFVFDQTIIKSIKESAMKAKNGSIQEIKASKVVVALALLWKAFMGLSVAKHGYLRAPVLNVAMNLREKLSYLRISEKSFGNFCIPRIVTSTNNDKMELQDLMIFLSNAIRDTSVKVAEARSDEDISKILIECRRELMEKRDLTDGFDVYICSSWCRFPLYDEADFGWGKPFWVSICSQPAEGVRLMDTKNGDGIEVWSNIGECSYMKSSHQHFSCQTWEFKPFFALPCNRIARKNITERSFGNFWFPVVAHYEGRPSKLELHELVSILDNAVKRTAENIKKASRDEIFLTATYAFKKMVD
ncbi:hypothetical protein ACH5RR_022411 [Cinchona calisaya]|uniref:BAHD acyltransferase n=1 Tax=Cinchona calisaya TaxID=153742 RepID=A0ABD2Z8U8_9GENT